jgi:hypothetical protein
VLIVASSILWISVPWIAGNKVVSRPPTSSARGKPTMRSASLFA